MFIACMATVSPMPSVRRLREAVHVRGLAARDAAVVGIEEAHEPDAGPPGLLGEVGTGSSGMSGGHGARQDTASV